MAQESHGERVRMRVDGTRSQPVDVIVERGDDCRVHLRVRSVDTDPITDIANLELTNEEAQIVLRNFRLVLGQLPLGHRGV